MEKALGEKLEVKEVSNQEAIERGKTEFGEGKFEHVSEWIMAVLTSGLDESVHGGPDNEVLFGRGTKGKGELEELVRKVVEGEEV